MAIHLRKFGVSLVAMTMSVAGLLVVSSGSVAGAAPKSKVGTITVGTLYLAFRTS